jgi:hypothetical protein
MISRDCGASHHGHGVLQRGWQMSSSRAVSRGEPVRIGLKSRRGQVPDGDRGRGEHGEGEDKAEHAEGIAPAQGGVRCRQPVLCSGPQNGGLGNRDVDGTGTDGKTW